MLPAASSWLTGRDPAGRRQHSQVIARGRLKLEPPSHTEIYLLAQDAFHSASEEVPSKRAEEEQQTLADASRTGNSGTYPNALVVLSVQRVQEMILAGIEGYLDIFANCEVPAVNETERFFETSAKQIAGGAGSWVKGQLDLYKRRTNKEVSDPSEYLNRTINRAMASALKKGTLKLRQQRIKF